MTPHGARGNEADPQQLSELFLSVVMQYFVQNQLRRQADQMCLAGHRWQLVALQAGVVHTVQHTSCASYTPVLGVNGQHC